VTCTFTR